MHGGMTLRSRAQIAPGRSIRRTWTLVVDVNGRVLHFIDWRRALTMVTSGQAYVIETVQRRTETGALEEVVVRSPSVEMALPLTIGLMPSVKVPAVAFVQSRTERAGRRAILDRDGHVCTYCGERARTIDHIFPRSRGGKSTWQNLVAACADCNGDKGDRTPEEAGMEMLFDPRVMEGGLEDLQAEFWSRL